MNEQQPTRDQLRALADKATEGPWEVKGDELAGTGVAHCCMTPDAEDRADMEFIAAARNALPALLDALDQAEAEAKRLSWKCGHLADKYAQDTDELRQEADQAEARIQAVRDVLDRAHDNFEQPNEADIRRALDGT